MKKLLPIFNRIVLGLGLFVIALPVIALGGMDKAPDYVIVPCMLLGFIWFGMYLYGYQKVFKNIFNKKVTQPTTISEQYRNIKDVKTVQTLKRFESVPQNQLRQEVDINQEAIKETFILRLQIFIILAVGILIYLANTIKL